MAHQGLTLASLAVVATVAGCAHPAPPSAPPPRPGGGAAFLDDAHPLRYRSARFELSVPLPDGHGWTIDDHRTALLTATHAATDATLSLAHTTEADLMNRQRCEAAARAKGWVDDGDLQTVADEVIVGPGPYDSHVSVLVLPSATPHRAVSGHVFLFGAHLKRCLFAHYETRERPGEDEETLSARLAVARLQILGGVRIDAFDSPDLPRAR